MHGAIEARIMEINGTHQFGIEPKIKIDSKKFSLKNVGLESGSYC